MHKIAWALPQILCSVLNVQNCSLGDILQCHEATCSISPSFLKTVPNIQPDDENFWRSQKLRCFVTFWIVLMKCVLHLGFWTNELTWSRLSSEQYLTRIYVSGHVLDTSNCFMHHALTKNIDVFPLNNSRSIGGHKYIGTFFSSSSSTCLGYTWSNINMNNYRMHMAIHRNTSPYSFKKKQPWREVLDYTKKSLSDVNQGLLSHPEVMNEEMQSLFVLNIPPTDFCSEYTFNTHRA